MQIPDILTTRLRLVAITPELLEFQENSPHLLGEALGAIIPTTWPNTEWEPHVYAFMRTQFLNRPDTIGWHRYVLTAESGELTLIGGLGSHPVSANEAEVGYGMLHPWQNRGYATEATRALLQHLFCSGQHRVRAQTFPHLAASLKVMQKCGMRPDGPGEEPGAVCFAIEREQWRELSP